MQPSPVPPVPPPPVPLALTCPGPVRVPATAGQTATITYVTPTSTGGTAPVSVVCAPGSGSAAPIGTSPLTCTATDSASQTASCSFSATVFPTRFVAFGDSITEGKLATGEIIAGSYPANLRTLLVNQYGDQTIDVVNEGLGGETASAGVGRLPGVLSRDNPQVLLLLEGINDLTGGNPNRVSPMVDALRQMVRQARNAGVQVFLATLTPERAGGSRASAAGLIDTANDQIRQTAASEGATLVDLYQGFNGSPDPFIGSDGLHPTVDGYIKIAQIFFSGIDARVNAMSRAFWRYRSFEP